MSLKNNLRLTFEGILAFEAKSSKNFFETSALMHGFTDLRDVFWAISLSDDPAVTKDEAQVRFLDYLKKVGVKKYILEIKEIVERDIGRTAEDTQESEVSEDKKKAEQ